MITMNKFLNRLKKIDSLFRLLSRLTLLCVLAFMVLLPKLGVDYKVTLTSVVIIILFAINIEFDALKDALKKGFDKVERAIDNDDEYTCSCPEGDRCTDLGGIGRCVREE